jgi:hypothetical protein
MSGQVNDAIGISRIKTVYPNCLGTNNEQRILPRHRI